MNNGQKDTLEILVLGIVTDNDIPATKAPELYNIVEGHILQWLEEAGQ